MIWNILSHKFSNTPALLCIAFLLSTGAALAQPQVDVKVHVKGDTLYVDTNTKAGEPQQRMNPDPAYLELSFPKSALSGAFTKPIDKGLIKKVVTSQDADNTLVRVYVLSKPKTELTKTDSGFRYSLKISEMAGAPARSAAAPATPAPAEKPAPVEKPVPAEKPAPIEKPAPAEKPAPVEKPVATKPVEKPQPTTKPAPATPPATTKPAETRTVTPSPTTTAPVASGKLVREYFPFKNKSAEKVKQAAQLAFPNATYVVDPVLNILMVEGTPQEIDELEKFLRAQSPK